ncbi:MAG: hypothetical protein IIY72_10085 [Solobacterium sp.]|nr:hypothetical protein [Solobacterium sp.]MBQ1320113.1 hypothetical protein [Solobacterium sp.]MBQ1356818.1 hypothetical protein [Solobacterium sp.]
MKLKCKAVYWLILAAGLLLTGCVNQTVSPIASFLDAEPDSIEFRITFRYKNPVTERVDPYLSGWLSANPNAVPDEQEYAEQFRQFISETGEDTITRLQEVLRSAALKETDKPTDEKEINYMVRLSDETVYSFYRNDYLKIVQGDARQIYSVESSAYDELMQELDEYIPFWTTAEFREEMFPDS